MKLEPNVTGDYTPINELPYFDERVRSPDFRIEYALDGRERPSMW